MGINQPSSLRVILHRNLAPLINRRRQVVGIFGGLGNQLFQYCWAEYLTSSSRLPVRFDLSALRSGPRSLELEDLGLSVASRELRIMRHLPFVGGRADVAARAVRLLIGPSRIVLEKAGVSYNTFHPSWWYGYWQSRTMAATVLDGIRASLQIPPQRSGTIGVHVRRGDFVSLGLDLDPSFYHGAVSLLTDSYPEISAVSVYSDDLEWCRANLKFNRPVCFEASGSAADDLRDLASHEYLVLSRGTFGWWASHLVARAAGTVVAPSPYLPGSPERDVQLVDPSWRTLAGG